MYRVALLRVEDRRLEQIAPGKMTEAAVERIPSGDSSGHRHCVDANGRHRDHALCFKVLDRQSLRSPSARVQAIKLAGFGVPVDCKEITTHAVRHRLGHAENGVGSDSCVNRRAAMSQNLRSGNGGLRVAGGNDAVGSDDHGASIGAVLGERDDRHKEEKK